MSPGTAALSYLTTGKSVYDNIMGSGSAIIPNRGVAGGCASCDGENYGGARHRRPPTKRHLIGGLPQGLQSRIDMINPDTEIMDAGTLRMKGLGKVGGPTSDQLLQARGVMNNPYPDQPFYGYGVDGDEDESQNLTGLKARLNGGITYGAGRNHRADQFLTYEPVNDDVYENTGAEEELAGEGHYRDEYEEPKPIKHTKKNKPVNKNWCKVRTVKCPKEFRRPDICLDVNTIGDYKFIRDIYENLYYWICWLLG
jgi:hypothetical protein